MAAGQFPAKSCLETGLQASGNSGANVVLQRALPGEDVRPQRAFCGLNIPSQDVLVGLNGLLQDRLLICKLGSQSLHFRMYRALNSRIDQTADPLCHVIADFPDAAFVNVCVDANAEIVITRPGIEIQEPAPVINDSIGKS
jgi:hypothetical protein